MTTTLTRTRNADRVFWALIAAMVAADHDAPDIINHNATVRVPGGQTPVGDDAPAAPAGAPGAVVPGQRTEPLAVAAEQVTGRRVIYAVGGLKGGVGKTTFSIFLAMYWAMRGLRVLIVDADPISSTAFDWHESAKAAAVQGLGAPVPFDLEPCPSDQLDRILAARWLDYDVVVVDCGGESAGVWSSAVRICDHFVVVVGPKKAEVKKVKGTFDAAVDSIVKAGRAEDVTPHVVLTRVKSARDKGDQPHNQTMRNLLLDKNMPLLGHEIPDLVEYEDACDTVPTRLGHYAAVFDEMHEIHEGVAV